MKELLQLQNICVEIKDYPIFKNVNLHVQQGDIIGIIGKNGAGKTTLLHILNHDLTPTEGLINFIQSDLKVVLVEQETESHSFKDVSTQEIELLAKWNVPTHDYSKLSGGEKVKARLAKGLSQQTDLLLLDEPTNHLDEESLVLLIKQIKQHKGTIIFVSHDRYFLDHVATKIWSIEKDQIISHKGNYSSYMKFREQKRLSQQREHEKQQKMVERIEAQMKELTSWSNQAHAQSTKKEGFKEHYRAKAKRMDAQVKSKQKRLEKELKKMNVKQPDQEYEVQFSMKANTKVGKRFLEVKHLAKSFNRRLLFQDSNFTIQHGDKVSIIGPNGSGKTTLLKIITGLETADGTIWISPSVKIGYLTQDVFDLPLEQTPHQLFERETFEERGHVQNLMKHLGFTASQWSQPIKNMSMGERVKCKLMKFILEERDVLILDEPTNHLDLPSREQLENTLAQYNGTLLVVSHDRFFTEKTTTSKLIIANNQIYKQLSETALKINESEELRLQLETARQEVLGKLSFVTKESKDYLELDQRFKELTKRINEL
ncbi:ribosomal protection-like ABC-F family protein [Halalkalibacter akibai]|uniref:Ribosome protection protein VmlR n=1 Tax=Halalkalibacter akibai (strain ATCC 43226 / DSM 21942 / CIP 109018 / JCM 9157 / 1139) TaxID=1236973 RepID=W4QW50_HALA3|nr:ABC-F type ribosomal protection protein [Halalkalibacter akibai]GAE35539.1 ABC transporter [Halalkalibacter akibai JCM 9157]